MKRISTALLACAIPWFANAQDAKPLGGEKPVFIPGMYEAESRNSKFQDQPVKSEACIDSTDFDDFMDDTLAQYRNAPHFTAACTLGNTLVDGEGFAFAMDCKGTKTIVTFKFMKDGIVAQTIENLIEQMPEASSKILTMMRRTGECPGQPPVEKGT